jgi:hypothetical protein
MVAAGSAAVLNPNTSSVQQCSTTIINQSNRLPKEIPKRKKDKQ